MPDTRFDVIGIGNAIVDILVHADDAFLNTHGLTKGAMSLVDADTAAALYEQAGPAIECSGGSAANTIAALASLGGRGAFIGKVRDDQLGGVFAHDIRAIGIDFATPPATSGAATATCLVLVTPDAERTMQTYLGACVDLGPADISERDITDARVIYMEGYLWDPPAAKQAFLKAAEIARGAGREVALSLSDPFCVDRHRDDFLDLVANHVDILFANEDEITSLYQVSDFDTAVAEVRGQCRVAALTRGAAGSVIVTDEGDYAVAGEAVERVVDTTGAGDAYAAGFLAGYTAGRDFAVAARMGNIAAAETISHMGARPDTSLADVVAAKLAIA